jgi:hypothetical protein
VVDLPDEAYADAPKVADQLLEMVGSVAEKVIGYAACPVLVVQG